MMPKTPDIGDDFPTRSRLLFAGVAPQMHCGLPIGAIQNPLKYFRLTITKKFYRDSIYRQIESFLNSIGMVENSSG
jgi:hypothetical protein